MGINTVSVVGPRAEPQQQEKPKKDTLEMILQGLQIANSAMGIGANFTTIQKHMDERAVAQDLRQGILSQKDKAAHLSTLENVPENTPGATPMKYRVADGDEPGAVETLWQMAKKTEPKAPEMKTRLVETKSPDGKPVQKIVEDKVGAEFPSYEKPKDTAVADAKKDERHKAAVERAQGKLNQELLKVREEVNVASQVREMAELGKLNPIAAANLGSRLARANGEKGVLTDKDVDRHGGSQALADKIARYVKRAEEGTLTDEDARFSIEMADMLERSARQKETQVSEHFVRQFTRNYGGDFAENYGVIVGTDYEPPASTQAPGEPQRKPESGTAFAAPASEGLTVPVPMRGATGVAPKPTADDLKAMDWAKQNPKDPRAQQIRQTLQAKGLL